MYTILFDLFKKRIHVSTKYDILKEKWSLNIYVMFIFFAATRMESTQNWEAENREWDDEWEQMRRIAHFYLFSASQAVQSQFCVDSTL